MIKEEKLYVAHDGVSFKFKANAEAYDYLVTKVEKLLEDYSNYKLSSTEYKQHDVENVRNFIIEGLKLLYESHTIGELNITESQANMFLKIIQDLDENFVYLQRAISEVIDKRLFTLRFLGGTLCSFTLDGKEFKNFVCKTNYLNNPENFVLVYKPL